MIKDLVRYVIVNTPYVFLKNQTGFLYICKGLAVFIGVNVRTARE
jgi:hypothetical protein